MVPIKEYGYVLSFALHMILLKCYCCALTEFGLKQEDLVTQLKMPQCREQCMDNFNSDDLSCLQQTDCSMCDFPSYNFNRFSDAHDLMCWKSCSSTSSNVKLNKSQLDVIKLKIVSMIRDGSLTSADITWSSTMNVPSQCLVTWEVSGGGLMGNLLTDSPEVELSLWPDTKYRIQVTCKNKETGKMSKSLPLLIDTSKANVLTHRHPSTFETTTQLPTTKLLLFSSSSEQTESIANEPQSSSTSPSTVAPETTTLSTITTTAPTSPRNIKVILAGHQQKSSTITKSLPNQTIKIEATIAIFISFLLFLVICLIFSIKRKQKLLNDCDKMKLINNDNLVNNSSASRYSLESTEFLPRYHHQQTIHV